MAKVNVKLLNVVAGSGGCFYGVDFTAIGKGKLSKDKTHFTGITLVAEGVDKDIVESLIDAERVEVLSDTEVKALKTKADKAK